MHSEEILKRAFAPYSKALTNASTFPDTTVCPGASRIKIVNADASNTVTITLTFNDGSTLPIIVKATGVEELNTKIIKQISKSGSSTSFQIFLGVPV